MDDLVYDLIAKIKDDAESGMADEEILAKYGADCSEEEREALEEILELKKENMLFSVLKALKRLRSERVLLM